ncbi:hypothetical protein [Arcobacter sp. LA11]|uniref:hypothetical protein n=1 Tax=Arcobacter sp. LA11 TaxID=1898176 RepID=UPI000A57085E|nr:hypothetical protein [Arcobacter sp. LA11]
MSMSQEEIESLMNGLDFEDEPAAEESPVEDSAPAGNMSEDDINELIAQTEDISVNEEDNSSTEESVDDLLNSLEDIEASSEESNDESETNIDDILKELEQNDDSSEAEIDIPDDLINPETSLSEEEPVVNLEEAEAISEVENSIELPEEKTVVEESSDDDIDELLSTIDNMKEPEATPVEEVLEESNISTLDNDDIGKGWTDNKIQEGIFPLPVEDDTKVVNQLSEVANDSEEKATKIFDVLSNILDYNNGIQSDVKELSSFNEKQIAMLTSLSQKFPNIDVFKENLAQAEEMGNHISNVHDKLNNGNNEIFQAMELMQFNDINRQKIERVMSVIRKLSTYLNNLFEDDGNRQEVAVANHIHGDSTEDLLGDEDLESLIAEFNN